MKNLNLTEKEKTVLDCLIDSLYAEAGFSDVCASDLNSMTKLGMNVIGGVLTSLQSKGIIWISEAEYWLGKLEIPALVYLCEEHYDMHPEWEV